MRAPACLPSPIRSIFDSPLSTRPENCVCVLMRLHTTTWSAAYACWSRWMGMPSADSPMTTVTVEARMGQPQKRSVMP